MATGTLTQINPNPGTFVPPFQGTLSMHDPSVPPVLTSTGVFVSWDNGGVNLCNFQQWGPSDATVDSVTPSGNYQGTGLPNHVVITFHGTGNMTGKGNDDTYSGTLTADLTYSSEGNRHEIVFKNGSVSLTYTD